MTSVELFDSGTGTWNAITYGDFEIEHGTSDTQLAPTASVTSIRGADPSVGQRLRVIDDDGTLQFEGDIVRTPRRTTAGRGNLAIDAEHDAHQLFEELVTLSETSPTDEQVLSAALSAAASGSNFTLDYAGTATSLGDDYDVSERRLKRVFRDMMDRTGRVWWVGVDNTIHVEPRGHRGLFAAVDTSTDDAVVREYNPADIDTVVNVAEVTGTGDVAVSATATDSNSVSTYGRRPESVNVEYVVSQAEAQNYADALLLPTPLANARVTLAQSVGDVRVPIVNYELDVTDSQSTAMDEQLVIQSQTVAEGRADVALGEGAGVNKAKFNRTRKSDDDKTAAGTVFGNDRLADDAVDTNQLVDTAVIEEKIANLSVSKTKVKDGAIATPKLEAEAVTAAKILAGTITASEVEAGTLTANEIDTLDLDAGELTVSDDPTNPSNGVTFDFDSTSNVVSILPINNEEARIGEQGGPRFIGVHSLVHTGGTYLADTSIRPSASGAGSADLGGSSFLWNNVFTQDITLGEDGSSKIVADQGVVGVELLPGIDGDCKVGNGNFQFDEIHAEQFISDGSEIGGGVGSDVTLNSITVENDPDQDDTLTFILSDSSSELKIVDRDIGGITSPTFRPSISGRWDLGTSGEYWETVHAGNFVTQTPEPLDAVDAADILGYSWRKPPLYATQKERDDGYRRTNPDKEGIDLGHMSNYLFEVTKAQSETITEQQDRIDALEATVADLEARLSDLESGANT